MKHYNKTLIISAVIYFAAILAFTVITGRAGSEVSGRDTAIIKLNDISKDAEKFFDDPGKLSEKDYGTGFVFIDEAGNVLYENLPDGEEVISLTDAQKKGCLYSYVTVNDKPVGYVILPDDALSRWKHTRSVMIAGLVTMGILLALIAFFFGRYVNKNILIPFENMKKFAGYVAEGRLDVPLEMDRTNMFGAFTESFDIMREELDASKKREVALQRRERELVASLSHDLKTPITGIKLTCELLKAKLEKKDVADLDASYVNEKLDNIFGKADQIDVLVSDLFSSTLEELDELKVCCTDEKSEVLGQIISRYDDRDLATCGAIPEVLIHIDAKRMSQVIGNIISNSYKYAATPIEVNYKQSGDFLEMSIRDFGPGVSEDEIGLITNKFYRGKAWDKTSGEGSGLGLYIASILMEKMDGDLLTSSDGKGLTITLMIPLA